MEIVLIMLAAIMINHLIQKVLKRKFAMDTANEMSELMENLPYRKLFKTIEFITLSAVIIAAIFLVQGNAHIVLILIPIGIQFINKLVFIFFQWKATRDFYNLIPLIIEETIILLAFMTIFLYAASA